MKSWYSDLASDVTRRRRVFAQIGSFHRTASFVDDVCEALSDLGLRPIICSVNQLTRQLVECDLGVGTVVVVSDFEEVLQIAHPEANLRLCRPNLQKVGEVGAGWLIISKVPESRYPLVDGSSVTIDSARYRMRYLERGQLNQLSDVSSKDIERIESFAGGSRAVADALSRIVSGDLQRSEQNAQARVVTMEVLTNTLKELGPELLALLEQWTFEYNVLRVSTADVRNDALLELRSSGVAEVDAADECVEFFRPPHTATWRRALNAALSDLLEAPTQWGTVVADLFFIERRLRRAIVRLLEERYGKKWQARLPADMQSRIVDAFRRDVSPRVRAITSVERPLDWVTLGDLFELAARFSPNDPLDGLSSTEWRSIADAILPVRNRVSHMRLLREGDRQAVRRARWRITDAASV